MVLRIGRGRGFGHSNRKTRGNGVINIVAPLIAGSLTDGSTITCTPGTWFGGIPTRQWYRDGVAISGATGLTYTYSAATDDGCYINLVETNGGVTSTSNALITGQVLNAYSSSFVAADGTNLTGFEGWSGGAYTNVLVLNNDLYQYANGGSLAYTHEAGSNDHEIVIPYELPVPASVGDSANNRSIYVRYTDNNNYISLNFQPNGYALTKRVAGVTTSLQSFAGFSRFLVAGDLLTLSVSGNYVRVLMNGAPTAATVAANGGLGFLVSGVPASTKVGFNIGNQGTGVFPFKVLSNVWINRIPANKIDLVSATIQDVAGAIGQQNVRLTGNLTGSITQLQYALIDSQGKVLSDWQNLSGISGGTFDTTTPNLPQSAEGKNVTIYLRDATNKNALASSAQSVPVAAQQVFSTFGMNGSSGAYNVTNLVEKMGLYGKRNGSWRNPFDANSTWVMDSAVSPSYAASADFGLDQNGFPTKFPNDVAGYSTDPNVDYPFYFLNLRSGVPAGLVGTYDVTFTPGLRWVMGTTASADPLLILTNYNEAAGTATLTVRNHRATTGSDLYNFDFKGYNSGSGYVAGIMPPAGTGYFRAIRQGSNNKYYDQASIDCIGGIITRGSTAKGYFRNMGDLGINRPALTGLTHGETIRRRLPTSVGRAAGGQTICYEQMVEIAQRTQTNVWLNIPDNATPEFIAEAAAFWRDNLPAGLKLALEYSNECWNFGPGFMQASTLLYSVPNYTGGNVSIPENSYLKGGTSGLVRRVGKQYVSSGTIAGGNASGFIVLRGGFTNTGFTAGESLHLCDSAGTVITSNVATVDGTDSGHHVRYARRVRWFLDLWEQAWPANDRVEPVLAWQAANTPYSFIQAMLDEGSLYSRIKKLAIGPYVGGGIASGDLGNYSSVNFFTKAQRDVIDPAGANDPALFKTNAFNAMTAMSDATKVVWRTFVTNLARYCVSKGLSRTAIRPATYEHMWQHIIEQNTPTGQAAATKAAFAEMLRDARAGAQQVYQNQWLAETGGDFVAFAHLGYNPASLPSYGYWSFADFVGTENQEPYASSAAWIAANT